MEQVNIYKCRYLHFKLWVVLENVLFNCVIFSKLFHFSLTMLYFRAHTQVAFTLLRDEQESSFPKPTDFKSIHDSVSRCATRQTKNLASPGVQGQYHLPWVLRSQAVRWQGNAFSSTSFCYSHSVDSISKAAEREPDENVLIKI